MRIRSITPEELGKFAASGEHPLGAEGFAQIVSEAWDTGHSRPEWCFVAEENSQFIARIVYSATDHEATYFGLHLPENALEAGVPLLRKSLKKLQKSGITHLERRLVSDWANVEQERQLLAALNIPMIQDKARYRRENTAPLPAESRRLTYHDLDEVGANEFIDAIRCVTNGTLDRSDLIQRQILGDQGHAEEYFDVLQEYFESDPSWWLLGYTPDEQLVGLVIAVKFGGEALGSIGYIGVVPEQRGKGYIHDFLVRGTSILYTAGIPSVLADTDTRNQPMISAFEKAGYSHVGTTYVYLAELAKIVR